MDTTSRREDAGAPDTEAETEFKITAAMVEAGLDVYLDHCPDSGHGDALDREMIGKIIKAAMSCGARPRTDPQLDAKRP